MFVIQILKTTKKVQQKIFFVEKLFTAKVFLSKTNQVFHNFQK